MAGLVVEGLGRTYQGAGVVRALRDVSLSVMQGEFVSIEGPSGAGKSTLLNLLALLDRPTSGSYYISDQDVSELSDNERAMLRSRNFGFVFQSFHLLDTRTVVDNVALGTVYRGLTQAEREERAVEALEFVGLGHKQGQLAGTLSGGERQRVAIARAISAGTPVLVADEPTGNLDQAAGKVVLETLTRLVELGTTVIMVTHDPKVAAIAGRRLRVVDGKLAVDSRVVNNWKHDDPIDETNFRESAPIPPGTDSKVLLKEAFRDAWRNLWGSPRRTFGLIAAVALGVGLALSTLGLADTARYQVSDIFDSARNIRVTLGIDYGGSPSLPLMEETLTSAALERLTKIAGVESGAIITELPDRKVDINDGNTIELMTFGFLDGKIPEKIFKIDTEGMGNLSASDSSISNDTSLVLHDDQVIVGSRAAKSLNLGPLLAQPSVLIDGRRYEVVAILRDPGLITDLYDALIVNQPSFDAVGDRFISQWGLPSSASTELRVAPGAAGQVGSQANSAWAPYLSEELIKVNAPPDPQTMRSQIEGSLATTLLTLTVVSGLAALLLLANTMNFSVYQRAGEFGLRRAMGAKRLHITGLVVNEAFIVGTIGGMFGIVIAVAGIIVVTIMQGWQPVLNPSLIPLGVVAGIAVGFLGSLLAARSASKIEPSDALRT